MNWFTYLVKTPWAQKKQDWAEFKQISGALQDAKICLEKTEQGVLHIFFEEELFEEVDACLKERVMLARTRPLNETPYDYELMHFQDSRCTNFVPIGDEKLCPCTACPAHPANKAYYDARNNVARLKGEYKKFWKNKFNQKTK